MCITIYNATILNCLRRLVARVTSSKRAAVRCEAVTEECVNGLLRAVLNSVGADGSFPLQKDRIISAYSKGGFLLLFLRNGSFFVI